MKFNCPIGETACREHLMTGERLTSMEATILFGVGDLARLISRMRREGYVVKSNKCAYVAAMVRINKWAKLRPPRDLPIKEILLTEYWINK